MSFSHPFGDFAAFVFFGAIALALLLGIGAPWWAIALTFAVLYGLIALIIGLFQRSGSDEEIKEQKQKDRCQELLQQAYDACRKASKDSTAHHKTRQEPKNIKVRQALFGPDTVNQPELFEILLTAWRTDERDIELALHLMFTTWDLQDQYYDDYTSNLDDHTLSEVFQQAYEYVGGDQSSNCTFLLTSAHMILLFDYRTGLTISDAEPCLQRFLEICPSGIPIFEFENRGNFGEYFANMIKPYYGDE